MKFLVLVRGFGGIDIDQLDSHLGIILAGINDRHIGTHASDPADVGVRYDLVATGGDAIGGGRYEIIAESYDRFVSAVNRFLHDPASHSLASAGIDIQDDRLDIILVVASV